MTIPPSLMNPRIKIESLFIKHPWWGRFICAFFGYLIGGPVFALFGILIGNFFDRGLREHFSRPHLAYHQEHRPDIRLLFLETTFSVMGCLSKADGVVSRQEIQWANTLMDELALKAPQKKLARQYFNEGKKNTFNLNQALYHFKTSTQSNPELLRLFLDVQYHMIQIDGLSTSKIQKINTIFQSLGFAPIYQQQSFYSDYVSANQKPTHALHDAYALLGLHPDANAKEIKRAYRQLMSKNHPDKLIARGATPSAIKEANERTQAIRQAYERLTSHLNLKA